MKFIYENGASDAIPLTKVLITCPLIYPYIDPTSVANMKTIMGLDAASLPFNVNACLDQVTLKSQMR